jgi:hypothetical protein
VSCRILVTDDPRIVRLALGDPVQLDDLTTVETAARIAVADGRAVVIDLAVRRASRAVIDCIARLAAGGSPEVLAVRGADHVLRDALRRYRLDARIKLTEPEAGRAASTPI